MTITGAIVIFAVLWFIGLLVALPLNLSTQGEDGQIVPGTPSSAPTDPQIRRKMIRVTIVSFAIWVPIVAVIMSGWLTISDIDIWNRMGPPG